MLNMNKMVIMIVPLGKTSSSLMLLLLLKRFLKSLLLKMVMITEDIKTILFLVNFA
jgi:hypothetical protein